MTSPSPPHLLVGGTTGSGKSTLLHALVASMVTTYTPAETRLLLVDTKRVDGPVGRGCPTSWSPPSRRLTTRCGC